MIPRPSFDISEPVELANDGMVRFAPIELEREGRMLLWKWRRYNGVIEAIAGRIPSSLWGRWAGAANTNLRLCMGAALGLAFIALLVASVSVFEALLSIQLPSASEPPSLPPLTYETVITALYGLATALIVALVYLVSLLLAFAIFFVLYHIVLLVFLPGLALHELGHAVTLLKHGGEIESVGLAFVGPFVMGAFVEPNEDSVDDFTLRQKQEVYASGIIHNVALAAAFYGLSLVVTNDIGSTILFYVALIEAGNALLNALPLPKLDGGQYVRDSIASWFAIDSISLRS